MSKIRNLIITLALMVPGLAAFCISPYHSTKFFWGLVIQLCAAGILYWVTMPDPNKVVEYFDKMKENPKENFKVFIITLVIVLIPAVLISVGIKSGLLRFILFVVLWIMAMASSSAINDYIFIKVNKESLLAEKVKYDQAISLKDKQQEEKRKENAKRFEEAQKAERERIEKIETERRKIAEEKMQAVNANALQALSSKRKPRIQATASPMVYAALISGKIMGWNMAQSGLKMALSDPTPEALAAVEKVIAEFAGKEDITFYKLGGMRVFSNASIDSVRDEILGLALNDNLLMDPAYTQSLIAGLAGNANISNDIMAHLSFNPKILFEYQMLGVQMQLGQLITPKLDVIPDDGNIQNDEKQQKAEISTPVVDDEKTPVQNIKETSSIIDYDNIKQLINQLADDTGFNVQWKAKEQLQGIGAPAVPLLMEALKDSSRRVGAANALQAIGEPSVESLINALSDPEWRVRFIVAKTLGDLKVKKAVPQLINMLNDPQPEVRRYSAEALGSIGDPNALSPLKDRLNREDSMMAISGIEEGLRRLQKS